MARLRAAPPTKGALAYIEQWWDDARIVAQLVRGGLSWVWHDTGTSPPVAGNRKFVSARDAVKLIHDGDVVATSGLGGNQRASIIYWAIREAFEASGHPARLTIMNLGGHGGRGVAPGTMEELGRPGLCRRLVTSHFETFKAMLDLAAAGQCELQCLPLGVMALLTDALGRGQRSWLTTTGIGTRVDPRVGPGSRVGNTGGEQLVTVYGDRLRYRIPKIDVAIFNAPAADRHGNLYVKNCAMIGDSYEIARAAKRNRGRVIANVGLIVDEGYDQVFLPADMVDAVVYDPGTEQTAGVFHREHWPVLTTASDIPIAAGLAHIQFVNQLLGIASRRTAADAAVARLAASTLFANVRKGAYVSIGTGLPEEVSRAVFEAGRLADVTFVVESGVLGGLPAPGIYFGASLCPEQIVSSAAIFKLCHEKLDATCLGVLQADSQGNVNVSKRGEGPCNYVGPGGFIDLAEAAKTIVFVSAWMTHGQIAVEDAQLHIVKRGTPKFVDRVDEVTFNGPRAVAAGKRVFFATHVGLFQLTRRGMELIRVMPGLDIRRDIMDGTSMKVLLPASRRVPVVSRSIVTGQRFTLRPIVPQRAVRKSVVKAPRR